MNDDYENVEWNVHATTDVYTPLAEAQDPLTALSNSYDAKTFTQEVACKEPDKDFITYARNLPCFI